MYVKFLLLAIALCEGANKGWVDQRYVTDKVNAANRQILGLIRQTFMHLDAYNFIVLYKALVRPHMEFLNSCLVPFPLSSIYYYDCKRAKKPYQCFTRV